MDYRLEPGYPRDAPGFLFKRIRLCPIRAWSAKSWSYGLINIVNSRLAGRTASDENDL